MTTDRSGSSRDTPQNLGLTGPECHNVVAQVLAGVINNTSDKRLRCDGSRSMERIFNRVKYHPTIRGMKLSPVVFDRALWGSDIKFYTHCDQDGKRWLRADPESHDPNATEISFPRPGMLDPTGASMVQPGRTGQRQFGRQDS